MDKLSIFTKNKKVDIIQFAVPIIEIIFPLKFSPNRKYDHTYYFTCLLDFVQKATSWNKYNGCINYPISGKYLNSIHNEYCKRGIYEKINEALLNKYLSTNKEKKLKVQSIDASFIPNKQGIHNLNDIPEYMKNNKKKQNKSKNNKNKQNKSKNNKNEKNKSKNNKNEKNKYENNVNNNLIQFNRYNGRKKYFKISSVVDKFGTPLGSTIITGKGNEMNSVEETIKSIKVNLNTKKNSTHNRYKQFLLADSGYLSNKNINILKKIGYTPIMAYNKRNTKDERIIKKNIKTSQQKKIYKNRIIVESFFAWIKQYPVINQNYQKTVVSYKGLLSIASSILISKRI